MFFWLLLLMAGLALAFYFFQQRKGPPGRKEEKSALDILNERYARGEISKEEYEEKKRDIA